MEKTCSTYYYALGVEHRHVLSTRHSQENRKQSLFDIPEGSPPYEVRHRPRVVASPQGVTRVHTRARAKQQARAQRSLKSHREWTP